MYFLFLILVAEQFGILLTKLLGFRLSRTCLIAKEMVEVFQVVNLILVRAIPFNYLVIRTCKSCIVLFQPKQVKYRDTRE